VQTMHSGCSPASVVSLRLYVPALTTAFVTAVRDRQAGIVTGPAAVTGSSPPSPSRRCCS
jgi:hypothetical protein